MPPLRSRTYQKGSFDLLSDLRVWISSWIKLVDWVYWPFCSFSLFDMEVELKMLGFYW